MHVKVGIDVNIEDVLGKISMPTALDFYIKEHGHQEFMNKLYTFMGGLLAAVDEDVKRISNVRQDIKSVSDLMEEKQ